MDLAGGRVQLMFDGLPALGHVRSGRLRALAVTSPALWPTVPEPPTVAESGLQGLAQFTTTPCFGLLAPAGVPPERLACMNADVRAVLRQAEVRQAIENLGFAPADQDSAAFGQFIADETRRWSRVIRSRGITAG